MYRFSKMKINNDKLLAIVALFVFCYYPFAASAASQYKMTQPQKGKFVVEYVYNYVTRNYVPPVVFKPVSKANAMRSTPEQAFISHFSAMENQDYAWWLSGWTKDSQKIIEARNKKQHRTGKTWENIWGKVMAGNTIKIEQRVETGPYTFITYKMFDKKTGKVTFHSNYVCKNVKGKWYATEELAKDLMFQHFLEGKKRVTLDVR